MTAIKKIERTEFDFIGVDDSLSSLILEKNKSLWYIKSSDEKPVWICSNQVNVRSGYQLNQYKENPKDGSFIVDLDDQLKDRVVSVANNLKSEFFRQVLNTKLDNKLMTIKTLDQMWNESDVNELKVKLIPSKVAFFDNNNDLINSLVKKDNLPEIFKENIKVKLVIEPSFIWCFQKTKQIGICWIAKQIKLCEDLELDNVPEKEWSIFDHLT